MFFVLAGAGNLNTQLGTDFSIRSLTFTLDATSPISIGGSNLLTIGTGGLTDNSPSTITVSTNVALGATERWSNNSTNPMTFNGIVSGGGSSNLTLAGTGGFTLTGANTYTGSTTIFTGSATLSGTGSLLTTSGISLNAGTRLTLDDTATNLNDRLSDTTTLTSRGGILSLLGNAAGSSETIGTFDVESGASVIQTANAGASLTLGAAGTIPSLTRVSGGTVLFAAGSGSAIKAPNLTLINGIIGGWAVTGAAGGTGLDFATRDGSGNVVPFSSYTPFTTASLGTDNAKYNATGNQSINLTADTTVNSLYLTGGSTPVSGAGVVPPASYLVNGTGSATPTRAYGNGITFSNGAGGAQTVTLTIGAGGIISSGATSTGFYNNKADIPNMAFIGYLFDESGSANGRITTGAGLPDLVVYTDSNLRIASIIVDNGTSVGLTKSGPGILDISNGNNQTAKHNNSFTGKVTINEGVLLINAEGQLGTPVGLASGLIPDAITFNGGELRTYASTTFNANRGITLGTRGGTVTYAGGNTTNMTQKITGVGSFTLWSNGAYDQLGNGTQTMQFANTSLTNVNDYQGATNLWMTWSTNAAQTTVQLGQLRFDANNNIPPNSAVTANLVDINGVTQPNPITIAGVVRARAAINFTGSDRSGATQSFGSLAGDLDFINLTGTLTLGGNGLSTTYTGGISGAGGSITKVGSGTQTFSGANGYTGPTNINGGTLLIGTGTGITGAGSLATGAVTVGNGSLVGSLGGNGTVAGPVTVTSTGQLAPAMSSLTFNTLTIANNLTINPGGTLSYNFANPGNSDRITISGNGSLNLQAGSDILNITQLTGFGIGTYPLLIVGGTGTFTDSATFTINGRNNFNYLLLKPGDAIDPTAGGGNVPASQLWLEVLQGNPNLTWIGGVSANWDTSTANWSGDASVFTTGANATFDDFGVARPNVSVAAGGFTANSITFANSAVNYAFSGGAIAVTAGSGIVKNQAGSVTFNGAVTTALTTINAGSITVAGSLNSSNIKVAAAGTLSVSGSLGATNALNVAGIANFTNSAQTLATLFNDSGVTTGVVNLNGPTVLTVGSGGYNGSINGAGSLVKTSNGLLTLTGAASSFSGGVTIKQGILSVPTGLSGGAPGPLGSATTNIILGDTATTGTLQYTGLTATSNRGFTINAGGGVIEVAGVGQQLTLTGTVTNGANPLTLTGLGDGVLTTPLAGTGNVTKQGAGTWTLAGVNSASGAVAATLFTVGAGALTAMTGGTFSSLGAATVTLNGGVLGLSGTATGTFDNTINLAQSATINAFQSLPGGGTAGQTVTVGGTTNTAIASGQTLTVTTADLYTLNFGGNVSGAGGLTSNGIVGLLGATVNYTGPTVVSGGSLNSTPLINGTSSVTVNGGSMTANGGVTTPGAITTNNNGALNLNGASSASAINVNGTSTITSTAPVTVSGLVTINGGTFTNNGALTTSNLVVQTGLYNGNGTLTSPSGLTVNTGGTARVSAPDGLSTGPVFINGGTLKFDSAFGATGTTTYAGNSIQNDGTLQAASGTADLGTTFISTTKPHATPGVTGILSERFFRPVDAGTTDFLNNAGDPGITFDSAPNFATRTPGAIDTLGGGVALSFASPVLQTRANAIVPNFYPATDNEGVAWLGRITVGGPNLPAGPISFSTNSDDGSTLYIDVNRDGVFESTERIINNSGPHGVVAVQNTVTLAAGVYNIAIGWYNGNGGLQMDAKFLPGTGIPFASQTFINPGIQTDIFSGPATPGSRIQIDAGANLSAGGFAADVLAFNGVGGGSLFLKDHASTVTSAADFIQMTGNSATGFIDLGNNNVVNIVTLNLATNGTLIKTGTGVLNFTGAGQGVGDLMVNSGPLVIDGSITGTVTVNGGTLRGTGTAAVLHVVDGILDPGHGPGILNSGNLTFDGGTYAVDIAGNSAGIAYDQVNVAGAVALNNSITLTLNFSTYNPQDIVDKFVIINNDSTDPVSLNGPFSHFFYGDTELTEGTIFTATSGANTQQFQFTYAGGDGNDVALLALTTVPEPGTTLALLGGLAALASTRRRR